MLLRCVKAIQFKDGVFDQYSDVPSDSLVEGKIYFGWMLGGECVYNSMPGFLVFSENKEWKKYPFEAFEPTSGT